MDIVQHAAQPLEQWRPGVMTRMHISALTGAAALCVFEQFVAPGCGAPAHRHSVEEVLSILAGHAEVWLEDARATLGAGQSVVVAPGLRHGFRNIGATELHVRAILAAATFEAEFDDGHETRRRWQPA